MAKQLKGFTLIELIVVMGIVAILATAAIIAIRPAERFAQARNNKRDSSAAAILSAIHQQSADNQGVLPADVTSATTATCIGTDAACKDLTQELTPNYLPTLPTDPGGPGLTAGTATNTQYLVQYDATSKRVTISAPNAESRTISVSQ
jgi:prepilin-type N-terminal cleavage/methylation domain-containing protein